MRGGYGAPETLRSGSGEGYVLSNPLSAGELVLVGITGILGYGLADFVGRYMTTTAVAANASTNAIPPNATYSNDVATSTWPSWQAMAAQAAVAAVPGIAAAFVDSPWGRAALQGMMLGAGFSLFGGIFKSLMASMLSGSPLGQQLYAVEVEAQLIGNPWATAGSLGGGNFCQAGTAAVQSAASQQVAAPSGTTTTPGLTGLPRGVGARPGLRYPADPGPRALPGRGFGQSAAAPGLAPPNMTMVPTTPAPTPPALTPNPPVANPSPGGPARRPPKNASGRAPCNDAFSPIPQPGYSHPATPFEGGVLTNTGDVVAMPRSGTPTPGGPVSGPHQGGAGALAQVQDLAERAIRDESCLGKMPGGVLYGAFPMDSDAA
jgi:hypothetical protein